MALRTIYFAMLAIGTFAQDSICLLQSTAAVVTEPVTNHSTGKSGTSRRRRPTPSPTPPPTPSPTQPEGDAVSAGVGGASPIVPAGYVQIEPTNSASDNWWEDHDFYGFTLNGGDRLGRSTAALGDLDLDGVPDIAACASRDDDNGTNTGAVYILFMNRDLTVKRVQKISNDFGDFGSGVLQAQDRMGYSLAALGDVDGDGITDLLVGADGDDSGHSYSASLSSGSGAVYVVFLNRDGTVKGKQKISNTDGGLATALGTSVPLGSSDGFGQSAGALGDLDGDGVPDAAVGAPGANSKKGVLYCLLLNSDGTVKSAHTLQPTQSLAKKDGYSGRGVNALDLDGDGRPELAVGCYGCDTQGAVFILRLDTALQVASSSVISSDGTGGFDGALVADDAMFGHSLAALGDVDGDGVPDLAVSANKEGSGALFLLTLHQDGSVKSSTRIDNNTVDGTGPFSALQSLPAGDRFCRSLSAPGDLAGDGGFSVLCGAGASSTGDLHLLRFAGGSATSTAAPSSAVDAVSEVPDPVLPEGMDTTATPDIDRAREAPGVLFGVIAAATVTIFTV